MAAKDQANTNEDSSVLQKVARVIPGLGSSSTQPTQAKKSRSRKPKSTNVSGPVGQGTVTTSDGETKPLESIHQELSTGGASTPVVQVEPSQEGATAADDDVVEEKKTSAVEACSKRIRNISKKLRNIAVLEEKSGSLNADQQKAVASKPTLQAILKELEELLAVLKAEETEDHSREQRIQAVQARQRTKEIDAAVAEARKSSQQDLVLLFQFLHLHGLYTQPSGFAPPVLPPVVANATGQEVAAVRMLHDAFTNGPLLGGHDDALERLSKVAAGSEEEVLPQVTYARVKELVAGLTSTPETAEPGPSATLTPHEQPLQESSAVATPADSVVALVDGVTDQHQPSFMNASEIEQSQTPTTEEKVTSWADQVEPAAAPAPIDNLASSSHQQQLPTSTPVRDWSADDHGDELPPLSELSQGTVNAPAVPPIGASAVSPANVNAEGAAQQQQTFPGRGGRRGGYHHQNVGPDGQPRRGSFRGRGGRGGGRGGFQQQQQGGQGQGGDRSGEWRENRPPREDGGRGRGRGGRGRGGRGRGGLRGGNGPQNGASVAAPAPSTAA